MAIHHLHRRTISNQVATYTLVQQVSSVVHLVSLLYCELHADADLLVELNLIDQ